MGKVKAGEMHFAGFKPAPAGPFQVDSDGFVHDWLLIGPFANPGKRPHLAGRNYDFLKPIGGEAMVRLLPDMSVIYEFPAGRPEWETVPPRGAVKARPNHSTLKKTDLAGVMSPATYTVAYAYANVTAPEDREVKLCVGSDDGIQVWLNGTKVLDENVFRGAAPDQNSVPVRLRKGENRLMVKVDTDIGGWGFYLRFLDGNDQPVTDISLSW